MKVAKALADKKIILCCGTGGVGKTTTAAALALKMAMEGKKVALITIDPALRLATSLGLSSLSNEPQCIDSVITKSIGKPKGSLSALMLHSQATFLDFIEEIGGQSLKKKFAASELFSTVTGSFGGAHDYFAMEKLYKLHSSKEFDCIILDTPPARHTLDFLDAPDLIAKFFDDRIFSWFLVDAASSSFFERMRAKSTKAALDLLEKVTGGGVIADFVSIAPHIKQVKDAFVTRQKEVQALLTSSEAGALFISSPTDLEKGEAKPFLADARDKNVEILGFFVNRSLQSLTATEIKDWSEIPPEARKNYENLKLLAKEEKKSLSFLQEIAGSSKIIHTLPEQESDIHDIASLHSFSNFL